MGFFSSLFGMGMKPAGEGIKSALDGIGGMAESLRFAITGDTPPEIKAKIFELTTRIGEAQAKINEAEAQSPLLFVAGWRPFIGWIAGVSLALFFIPKFVIGAVLWVMVCINTGIISPYPVDAGGLFELVVGMLGLGVMRTFEKNKGINDIH